MAGSSSRKRIEADPVPENLCFITRNAFEGFIEHFTGVRVAILEGGPVERTSTSVQLCISWWTGISLKSQTTVYHRLFHVIISRHREAIVTS